MEIQVASGVWDHAKNLVLYIYFSSPTGGYRNNSFMAEVHETVKEGHHQGNPLFYCRGERFEDWERALTFIAFLSNGGSNLERNRQVLERWFLKAERYSIEFPFIYRLCFQICSQGRWQDIRVTKNRLSSCFTQNGQAIPTVVSKSMEEDMENTFLNNHKEIKFGS